MKETFREFFGREHPELQGKWAGDWEPQSWVLKAIEDEADRRATQRLFEDPGATHVLFGLKLQQIRWLRHQWVLANPGKSPQDIPS